MFLSPNIRPMCLFMLLKIQYLFFFFFRPVILSSLPLCDGGPTYYVGLFFVLTCSLILKSTLFLCGGLQLDYHLRLLELCVQSSVVGYMTSSVNRHRTFYSARVLHQQSLFVLRGCEMSRQHLTRIQSHTLLEINSKRKNPGMVGTTVLK